MIIRAIKYKSKMGYIFEFSSVTQEDLDLSEKIYIKKHVPILLVFTEVIDSLDLYESKCLSYCFSSWKENQDTIVEVEVKLLSKRERKVLDAVF